MIVIDTRKPPLIEAAFVLPAAPAALHLVSDRKSQDAKPCGSENERNISGELLCHCLLQIMPEPFRHDVIYGDENTMSTLAIEKVARVFRINQACQILKMPA